MQTVHSLWNKLLSAFPSYCFQARKPERIKNDRQKQQSVVCYCLGNSDWIPSVEIVLKPLSRYACLTKPVNVIKVISKHAD